MIFKVFYNLVLDKWVLQAEHGVSKCVLRKSLQIDNFPATVFSAVLMIECRTIHQAAKSWSGLVTANGVKFNWKMANLKVL